MDKLREQALNCQRSNSAKFVVPRNLDYAAITCTGLVKFLLQVHSLDEFANLIESFTANKFFEVH